MTPQPSGPAITTSRQLARAVLEQVERERAFANRALSAALDRARALSPEERSLATELVYGVLRRQVRLDRALEAVSDRGLSGLDPRVRIALRVAAYQILFLDRVPAYAAVNEAVEACKGLRGGPRIAGLANALLRRAGRSRRAAAARRRARPARLSGRGRRLAGVARAAGDRRARRRRGDRVRRDHRRAGAARGAREPPARRSRRPAGAPRRGASGRRARAVGDRARRRCSRGASTRRS